MSSPALFSSILAHLGLFRGVRSISPLQGRDTALVDFQPEIGDPRISFLVWDNGGELGIERVNSGEVPSFVPTVQSGGEVNAGTVALWTHAAIAGTPIDYLDRMDDFDEELLKLARA